MRRLRLMALALIYFTLAWATSAQAEKRVALVIGNGAYTHAPQLANPRNDADDFAAALKAHGVEVMKGLDLNKAAMDSEIRKFSAALSGADVGIFFYSGHGLQVSGTNYLARLRLRPTRCIRNPNSCGFPVDVSGLRPSLQGHALYMGA
jgi:hypothetical protein